MPVGLRIQVDNSPRLRYPSMKMESVLEAKRLTKTFKKFTAVSDASFALEKGEILGLLGVNGAGKTSIIQMLLGILTPTAGEVRYFGKPLLKNRGVLERINFSSTYTNLPWNLSVKECLTFSSYLYRIENRKQRIAEIAKIFEIEKLMSSLVRDLSSGQITRVNLAKAFLNKPEILLLDEPTASLDPESAQYIRDFILREQKQRELSILFTSHNMHEVEEVCDRIVFLQDGKIIADDTPMALARSVDISRVILLIKGKYETCSVPQKEIAQFLQGLAAKGIEYDEIEIKTPTLEDYFLKISKRNQ